MCDFILCLIFRDLPTDYFNVSPKNFPDQINIASSQRLENYNQYSKEQNNNSQDLRRRSLIIRQERKFESVSETDSLSLLLGRVQNCSLYRR